MEKKKNTYLYAVEEMIHIRRSEYEQLISQQEELIELVRELRAEIELLKNGRNSKTGSTAPSQDINRSNAHSLRKSSGKPSGGFLHSFYVSDCWASQLKTKAKVHQLCTAHLLRELLNFEKSLQDTWSIKMKELLYRAIALKYRDSGWLSALSKGVMYRTADKLLACPALSCYNLQLEKNFHIAAHSALELNGFNHYVPMGKTALMVRHPKQQLAPAWMKKDVFDKALKFFSTETFVTPPFANRINFKYYPI